VTNPLRRKAQLALRLREYAARERRLGDISRGGHAAHAQKHYQRIMTELRQQLKQETTR
jgi:hypothetical protein